MLDKCAGEAAASIRVDGGVSVSVGLCIKTRSVRGMTHYFQDVYGVEALVLSLMLKVKMSHSHTHTSAVAHTVILAHSWPEWSNSCPLWKTIFYSCVFHIEFLSRLASTAAKCKHSSLFIENQPRYPSKPFFQQMSAFQENRKNRLSFWSLYSPLSLLIWACVLNGLWMHYAWILIFCICFDWLHFF